MNYSPTRTATLFAVYLALCCASEDEESSPPSFTTVTTQSESPLDSESERVQRSQQHTRSSDTSTTNPLSFLSCNSYLRPFLLTAAANIQPSVTGTFLHFNTYHLISAQVAMWWLRLEKDKMFREYVKMI